VLERGDGMVLAAHRAPIGGGLVTQTVETVAFARPDTVDFPLVRGPVPHVRERFALTGDGGHARLEHTGEMAPAFGHWGWEATVADSLATVKAEGAERRHEVRHRRTARGSEGTAADNPTAGQTE
jgi:hypothetical protein